MALTRRHGRWIALALALAAILALALRSSPLDVVTAAVERGALRVTLDEEGRTRVRSHVTIATPISGRLAESLVRPGDTVVRGGVVARLAPAPLDPRARSEATAALGSARAALSEATARVEQARIALDEARRARGRAERLSQAGGMSAAELDAAVADERIRAREFEAASARQSAAEKDVRRASAGLIDADPARLTSQAPVAIRSPIAGQVLRLLEEHDRVVPAGTPIMDVGDPSTVEIVVDVLSRETEGLLPGTRALVRLTGRDPEPARVTRVEPAAYTKVSPLGVEEQRVTVIVRFERPVVGLGDAFDLDVSFIRWEGTNVLSVPSTALVPIDSAWAVYVVDQGRARLRNVRIGHRGNTAVEILDGVAAGERVVRHPDERFQDGIRVREATSTGRA